VGVVLLPNLQDLLWRQMRWNTNFLLSLDFELIMRHWNVSVILITHILNHSFYFAIIPCYRYINTSNYGKRYNCIIFKNIITKYGILHTKSPPSLRKIQAYCDSLLLQIDHYLLSYCGTSQYNTFTLLSISLWQSQVWLCHS